MQIFDDQKQILRKVVNDAHTFEMFQKLVIKALSEARVELAVYQLEAIWRAMKDELQTEEKEEKVGSDEPN